MAKRVGRVLWFSEAKGFGFIERQDGVSIFFHDGALRTSGAVTVADGSLVEFEVTDDRDCRQADSVRPL